MKIRSASNKININKNLMEISFDDNFEIDLQQRGREY